MLMHVYVKGNRRIAIYPEGGCCVETKVKGIGWVIDTDDTWTEADTEAMQKMRDGFRSCLEKLDMDVTV
jgi:hypothetical protein